MNTQELKQEIDKLSLAELKEIANYTIDYIDAKRKVKAKQTLRNLEVGQRVAVMKDGVKEFEGTVKKINRTRAIVAKDGDGLRTYSVPAGMISTDYLN